MSKIKVWHATLFGLVLLAIGGYVWVHNIITLFHSTSFGGTEIARALGIALFPLGAVLGYF